MQTCKTCKHFNRLDGARIGRCDAWLVGYGVDDDDLSDNDVLVEDDEGWAMRMGPDFGCILHEGNQP